MKRFDWYYVKEKDLTQQLESSTRVGWEVVSVQRVRLMGYFVLLRRNEP